MNSVGKDTWGGVEKWMWLVGCGMRDRGHAVWCGARPGSRFLQRCSESGLHESPVDMHGDVDPRTIATLVRRFKTHHIDVIIANLNKDVRLAGIAKNIVGKPVLISRAGLALLPDKPVYRHTYRWLSDGIITNTETIKATYLSYGWLPDDFIRVIYNGIEIQPLPQIDEAAIRRQFGLPVARPVVGIFGRLVHQKQHDKFLAVAKNIANQFPEAIFLITGDGPLQHEIEQMAEQLGIRERVFFSGFQQNPAALYAFCDLVLLTSAFEGMPNVVLEAMHYARPVIAFKVGGVPELIRSPETGIVVPPNDVAQMSEAALSLLSNPTAREQMGDAARQFVIAHFSLKTMLDHVEEYLMSKVKQ